MYLAICQTKNSETGLSAKGILLYVMNRHVSYIQQLFTNTNQKCLFTCPKKFKQTISNNTHPCYACLHIPLAHPGSLILISNTGLWEGNVTFIQDLHISIIAYNYLQLN